MGLFNYVRGTIGSLFGGGGSKERPPGDARIMAFRLLQDEGVRNELKLDVEQAGQMFKIIRETRSKHRAKVSKVMSLDKDRRREQGQKVMRGMAEEAMKAIDQADVLNEAQKHRLQQIVWQNRGAGVFLDPAVQDALSLTEGQREVTRNILEETNRKGRELVKPAGEGEYYEDAQQRMEDSQEKRNALRQEAEEKILALLSDEQRRCWDELKGEPFEVKLEGTAPNRLEETGPM